MVVKSVICDVCVFVGGMGRRERGGGGEPLPINYIGDTSPHPQPLNPPLNKNKNILYTLLINISYM